MVQAGLDTKRNARKNRLFLLIGAAIVVAFALAYAQLTMAAIHVRKQTSDVFQQWVLDHHAGTAQLVTDSSGLDGAFMVVTLAEPIPASQIAEKSLTYMKAYYSLDGGQTLTIQEHAADGKTAQLASVQYISDSHAVYINIHQGQDSGKTIKRTVSWQYVPDSTD